jgi:hypothetical protein
MMGTYASWKSIREFAAKNPEQSHRQIAAALDTTKARVTRALTPTSRGLVDPTANQTREHSQTIESSLSSDTGTVTTRSANIRTLEEALDAAKVDRVVWEVERYVVNSWEVTMGSKTSGTEQPETFTNFQVKVWLRRRIPKELTEAFEGVMAKMAEHAYPQPKVTHPKLTGETFMAEISIDDLHMGMRAWGEETGVSYDLPIADAIYRNAVSDLLARAKPFPVSKILFPFGNDFLHINDRSNTTPSAHNVLDVDGRFAKVVTTGFNCIRDSIEVARAIAPVEVVLIPGNHDTETSWVIAAMLQAFYSKCPDVTFNLSPKRRKAVVFGPTLLCFAHGQDERARDIAAVMMSEFREQFGKCQHFEVHTGHLHKKIQTRLRTTDTFDGGVVHRVLPSLSASDSWTYSKGYLHHRAAELYLWSNTGGYAGHFSVNAREK